MRDISLLIKPASGLCNIRCRHCFYCDLKQHGAGEFGIMTAETRRLLIRRALGEAERNVTFCFQGGEPTCAGLDFFCAFVAEAAAERKPGQQISYVIQTNGILIDDEWAAFLKEHAFLVGLSIDGPAAYHDRLRVDAQGKGTLRRVEQAWRTLQKHGVETNLLAVVTGASARHARQIYAYFKKLGARYLQFIACLDPLWQVRGGEDYSLQPARYGKFLCDLFDLWIADYDRGEYVSIRQFDDWVHNLAGMPVSTCMSTGRCGSYLVIEGDGSAYPCDFYVTAQTRLGDIQSATLSDLQEKQAAFVAESIPKPADCVDCPYLAACRGGCRRDRVFDAGQPRSNYFCPAYRQLFEHAWPQLNRLAELERRAYLGT